MTTLVPLLLGCSGSALGFPGSLGVVGLIAMGRCSCPLGWATSDGGLRVLPVCTEDWPVGLAPLRLSVCAAFAYLCPLQASGRWCVCGGMYWWM